MEVKPDSRLPVVFVRSAYNYSMDRASRLSGLSCPEPTRAQQQFKDECDINTIVKRFGLTGELPENVRMPVEGDFTAVTDYQSALNLIIAAEQGFMELPAHIREEFRNDPARLVAFVSDDKNAERARALGLTRPAPTPREPVIVRLAPDSAPANGPPGPPAPAPSPAPKAQ